jgi:hypothetical protein
MTDHKTCEERIPDELTSTEDWLSRTYRKIDKANEGGDYQREEELREEIEVYGVEVKRVMWLTLSGGGPASWLEVHLDDSGRWPVVEKVIYHFADWFDHAEREVSESEAPGMWRLAEYYAGVVERVA